MELNAVEDIGIIGDYSNATGQLSCVFIVTIEVCNSPMSNKSKFVTNN